MANNSLASEVGTAGSTVSYAVKVKNTGSAAAQYVVMLFPIGDDNGNNDSKYSMLQGGLNGLLGKNITAAATSDAGYTTPAIQPGKELAFTLRVTIPKAGLPGDLYSSGIYLVTTGENDFLDSAIQETEITATKGTSAIDEFMTAPGQASVRGMLDADFSGSVTLAAVPLNVGATANFTDKLANDSTSAAPMTFSMPSLSATFGGAVDCASNYTVTVKSGSTNVSALAMSTGYTTPVLAPKHTVSLTITIKRIGNAPCDYIGGGWLATTTAPSSQHSEVVWLSFPNAAS